MELTTWDRTITVSTSTPPLNITTESPSTYDHEGAMKFIISTILVYSLLGIVSMMISRLRKKTNSFGRQLDDDVSHFIKSGKMLRQSFHRQQLIFRRNTFVKMIKTREAMEALGMDVEEDGSIKKTENGSENENADDNIPKVTFHIENEDEKELRPFEEEKIPLKTLTESSCQTDDDLSSNSSGSKSQQEYDSYGAMLFVVATILVYAGAVVAFIAGHIKKRRSNNEEEVQIYKYLSKSQLKIQQKIRSNDVLQTRLQLLRAFQENTGCGNRRERNSFSTDPENMEDA